MVTASSLAEAVAVLESNTTLMQMNEALDCLIVYVTNLLDYPEDERFWKIRISNIHFEERMGCIEGWEEAMNAIGFFKKGDDLVFNEDRSIKVSDLKEELEKMLAQLTQKKELLQTQFERLPARLPKNHEFQSVKGAGDHSDIGRRHSMEDDEIMVDCFLGDKDTGFFAVYDGHGGRETVEFVVKSLHENLERLMKADPSRPWGEVIEEAYLLTDGQVRRYDILQSGTTAVTVLITVDKSTGKRILYSANAGDSRAVLFRNGVAERLTIDHKPHLPEEKERIESAGGFIGDRRVNGVLAISRALGDHMLKSHEVVTCRPYCREVELEETDNYLLLACDGVWDVMSDQDACDFVMERCKDFQEDSPAALNAHLDVVSKALVKHAYDKRSMDNITCMLIKLQ